MSRAVIVRVPLTRLLLPWAVVLTLAACSSGSLSPFGGSDAGPGSSAVGPSGTAAESRADQETRAACRQRANEMFDQRDRAQIYAANPSVNSPQSANYVEGVPSRGLSAQFDYERTVENCARNGAGAAGLTPPGPVLPPPVSTPPSPRGR